MTTQLTPKPCPFCGHEKITCWKRDDGWAVKCRGCATEINSYVSEKAAIEHWNTRPADLEAVTAERDQAQAELSAIDEALGEFHCPVDGGGAFFKDHGVHLAMRRIEELEAGNARLAEQVGRLMAALLPMSEAAL